MSQSTKAQQLIGQVVATGLPLFASAMDYRVASYEPCCDPRHSDSRNEHVIYVFWHEFIMPLISRWGWCDLTLLVSQHRDAEWLNQVAGRMGFQMARGSSTRGGPAAIRRLTQLGNQSSLVITPDGPRGPRRQMAPGAVYLASQLEMPIIPIGVGLSRAHRLNTWDKFAIPLPTSRVRVIFGPKIYLPGTDDREQLDRYRESVLCSVNELTHTAQRWADRELSFDSYEPPSRLCFGNIRTVKTPPRSVSVSETEEDEAEMSQQAA